MNLSKLLRRLTGGIAVVASVVVFTFGGCTYVDNSLGSDLTLEIQGMKLGKLSLNGLKDGVDYFESRLYRTDSISSSNLSYGYFGSMSNDTVGLRTASFYTQYIAGNKLEDNGFGYLPIFDSALLYLTVESYGGDTSVVQRFEVFQIENDDFFEDAKDTVFFPNFKMDQPYIDETKPVFTFNFPDVENGIYTTTTSLRMQETDYTAEFMQRLMLEKTTGDYDKTIYSDDKEWVKAFKGLYIRPVADDASKSAAIFGTKLESSGFGFYGRNREPNDYSLIKDTIGMTYVFYSTYAKAGNVSINMVDHNYDNSLINEAEVKTPSTPETTVIPATSTLRVEGMAGVVSEITFTKELFEELDTILEKETAESGEVYESLFFNQAQMKIYMTDVDGYNPADIDPLVVTPWMNYMPSSLGLYTRYANYVYERDGKNYTALTGVADYMYTYESSYTLDFGGAMNRSWGCYVLNIPGGLQSAWNNYLKAKAKAEESGSEIDWDSIKDRTVYLAPTASNLFTAKYASLQSGEAQNSAPISLELTYTMIR